MKKIENRDVMGQRVLVRADLNLPYHDGKFGDLTRLIRFLPTVQDLVTRGAKVMVLSHFGRPKGKKDAAFSLAPVAKLMEEHLAMPVRFIPDCIGEDVAIAMSEQSVGSVALLENIRFYKGEEENNRQFAQDLAAQADVFVNDAFSVSHRSHASVVGICHFLPSVMGPQMEAEVAALKAVLEKPSRPLVAMIGGSKISTKIELIMSLVGRVDQIILGGGMANTFLQVQGRHVGASLVEAGCETIVEKVRAAAELSGCQIVVPIDAQVAYSLTELEARVVDLDKVEPLDKIFDIGPKTVALYSDILKAARSIIWNGPLGVFEVSPYDRGTGAVAQCIAELTEQGRLLSVVGGGDTMAAMVAAGCQEKMTYVSTAGGAFLEWLEGQELPGVTALTNNTFQPSDLPAVREG